MTRSGLIDAITGRTEQLDDSDVELAIKCLLEQMSRALASGQRIEIRGFGSFSLHWRPSHTGRNPKTGRSVHVAGKFVPRFKPGKALCERVDGNENRSARRKFDV